MRNFVIAAVTMMLPTTFAYADFNPAVGDKVLSIRPRTNSYMVATVKTTSELDGGSVTFLDGTVQNFGPVSWNAALRPYDWKVGSTLECGADPKEAAKPETDTPSADMKSGTVTSIDAATVELSLAGGAKAKFALAGCRHHNTWWDGMSEQWKNYATYATAKSFPRKGASQPSPDEVSAAMADFLSGADGGSYIQIKKCVAIGKGWVKQNSGSDLTARSIDVACGIAVPLPPKPQENFTCLIEYAVCRQPYQGEGQFGGCEWRGGSRAPEQIKCAALK